MERRPLRETGAAFSVRIRPYGEVMGMEPASAMSLDDALALHRAGRLAEAEAAYRSLLAVHRGHPDLLRFLGLLRHQQGHAAEALDLLERGKPATKAPFPPVC